MLSLPGLCYCPRCDPASADYKQRHVNSKTKLCKFFMTSAGCVKGADCKFAHGEEELAPPPVAVPCLPDEDDEDLCVCPECDYCFCAACHEAYHPGSACVSAGAREAFLAAREQMLAEGGYGSGSSAQRQNLEAARARLEELKSLEMVRRISKPCPCCGSAIMRTEGCNHMQVCMPPPRSKSGPWSHRRSKVRPSHGNDACC